ncbi:methyltransferase domain-containing protein [Chloropicon primus]|uniref:Methyltransferase type 11 domain-containing protein n=1 Tax=Chloropicon primus TaxID=1764295 RepID=A0A5B8MSI8_9CHLO|nr:hypothetical protein A3770_10p59910 [Chloropicon primus]UPR02685.1 methyltransferase domain-containing protein [Chloropicon primus]|eukprot:QDZ23473.1 hypothetical protein A3770_10p59910 [Chloropicon primus]
MRTSGGRLCLRGLQLSRVGSEGVAASTSAACLGEAFDAPKRGGRAHWQTCFREEDGRLLVELGIGARRPYSTVFDAELKRKHRERVARIGRYDDRLQNEIASRLVDRLLDCTKSFEDILVVGGTGLVVARKIMDSGKGSVRSITYAETSPALLEDFETKVAAEYEGSGVAFRSVRLAVNEASLGEALADGERFDAAISCLGLHWVNDLPGCLAQVKGSLNPDGLFLGAFLGGDTLQEMRIACSIAEMEREGGVSPRTSPLARVRDAGSLMSAAAYNLPVVDVDTVQIRYPSASHVVDHLRRLGESSANTNRRGFLARDSALATAAIYQSLFAEEDGSVPSTYQVIYVSGWSPHESQQKPLQRGSATASLADLREEVESLRKEKNDENDGEEQGKEQEEGTTSTSGKGKEQQD